ncbi:hypothetical protein AB0M48_38935 [Lentzea sp. NPDC051208]|uniref:hypothetical protein n=1 Tax=Lentzea sp. NPDC051208 TaxID=3154642 RepID=UPI0034123BA4
MIITQPFLTSIGVHAMNQDQTDWATAYYYVATLWALVGDDFTEEWRHLRDSFERQLADVPAGHESGDRLRSALAALQSQVDEVAAVRAHSGASREDPGRLVPVFADLGRALRQFKKIVEDDVRHLPVGSGDEWDLAVDHVRNAVCELDKVWVSPALAPAFGDAIAYLGSIDLDALVRHAR